MSQKHFDFWPAGLPRTVTAPATNVFYNAEVSAERYPDKPLTFAGFKREAARLAGYLQHDCGVAPGDRVLLVMQNSPQFILSFYGILRANAVVVPVNPMSVTAELEHYLQDSGAKVALVAQEVYPQLKPLLGQDLQRAIVAAYSDYDAYVDLQQLLVRRQRGSQTAGRVCRCAAEVGHRQSAVAIAAGSGTGTRLRRGGVDSQTGRLRTRRKISWRPEHQKRLA